jgi:hypothetical protein
MALTVTFKNEAFPDGTVFHLEGVGALVNGEAVELNEEQERGFIAANRTTLQESTGDSEMWEVTGNPLVSSVEEVLGVKPEEISTTPVLTVVPPQEEENANAEKTLDLGGDQ